MKAIYLLMLSEGKISVVNYTIILVEVNEEIIPPSNNMKTEKVIFSNNHSSTM